MKKANEETQAAISATEPDEGLVKPLPTVTTIGSQILKCKLTDEELIDRGQKMANAQQAAVEIEGELEAFKAQIKGRLAREEGIIVAASSAIRQGYEHRPTECTTVKDYEAKTVMVQRNDTGEIIESRKMTADEASRLPL